MVHHGTSWYIMTIMLFKSPRLARKRNEEEINEEKDMGPVRKSSRFTMEVKKLPIFIFFYVYHGDIMVSQLGNRFFACFPWAILATQQQKMFRVIHVHLDLWQEMHPPEIKHGLIKTSMASAGILNCYVWLPTTTDLLSTGRFAPATRSITYCLMLSPGCFLICPFCYCLHLSKLIN